MKFKPRTTRDATEESGQIHGLFYRPLSNAGTEDIARTVDEFADGPVLVTGHDAEHGWGDNGEMSISYRGETFTATEGDVVAFRSDARISLDPDEGSDVGEPGVEPGLAELAEIAAAGPAPVEMVAGALRPGDIVVSWDGARRITSAETTHHGRALLRFEHRVELREATDPVLVQRRPRLPRAHQVSSVSRLLSSAQYPSVHDATFPCASLLKPAYALLAPEAAAEDKRAACADSDNDATDRIIAAAGGLEVMRLRIAAETGVTLSPAPTWGRFLVRAGDVAQIYTELARMRGVESVTSLLAGERSEPTFGARYSKLGWDVHANIAYLHQVRIVDEDQGPAAGRVDVVLTATTIDELDALRWRRLLAVTGPFGALDVNISWAGRILNSAHSHLN